MPDTEELKRRLANAMPEPSAVTKQEQPAGVQPPAAPETVAPPEPEPEPDRNAEYLAEIERKDAELAQARQEVEQRQQEAETLRRQLQERAKLPTAEELDGLSQGEAILKMASAMTAAQEAKLQDFASDLNRNVAAPLKQTVGEIALQQKREIAKGAYPSVDMNKYRKAFDTKARQYPDLSPVEVLKMVADPRDLSGRPSEPTTPAPQAAAHMELGRSAHASQPVPSNSRSGGQVTTTDLLQAAADAEAKGDRQTAKELRGQATKLRLTHQGVLSPGG